MRKKNIPKTKPALTRKIAPKGHRSFPVCRPNKIGFSFQENANWRIFRIMAEFVEGFQFLSELQREVSVFGSARFHPDRHPGAHHYKEAYRLAKLLGKKGFTLITGGGPGIMEAANKGATDSNAESVGLNIQLPAEQRNNPYVKKSVAFHYFFTRKVMLSASAQAYVFFPGGFGTLDEFFEIVTLIQTGKMDPIPVILIGKDFWQPIIDWIRVHMYQKHHTIDKTDMDIYYLAMSVDEAVEIISRTKEREYFNT